METEIVKMEASSDPRRGLRMMSEEMWIDKHGSGTLRKNARLGFSFRNQYLSERIAWEFGHAFEILPRSRVLFGDAFTEGDCHAVTEAGWFIDRYVTQMGAVFPEETYWVKSIKVEEPGGKTREGIGIIIRGTIAPWIPKGHLVFAIIAQFKNGQYLPAENPL